MLLLVAKKRMLSPLSVSFFSCYFSTATQIPSASDPKPDLNFLADHLVKSWGFSPNKAAVISKRLPELKTPDKPDAVLRFLTRQGFAKSDIHTLTTWHPTLLHSSPQNTLDPNLRALRDIGLSTSLLTQILLTSPAALHLRSAVPRIKFWKDFLGGDEATLLKAFKHNRCLVSHDITRNIAPKIAFLQTQGFTTSEIRKIAVTIPRFMTSNIRYIENLLRRARELGTETLSGGMFVAMLKAAGQAREVLQKKKEILKSFGWSEDEFISALQKAPTMVTLSTENLLAKMDFLVGEVRCDTSHIVSKPTLLAFSLEKRLRPRHHVLHFLESKRLLSKKPTFFTAIVLSDIKFVEKYILPHEKEISGLHDAYFAAAVSGTTSPFQKFK